MTVFSDIEKARTKLVKQAIAKGICENFGQKEINKLIEKHGNCGLVQCFSKWCECVDLNELHYLK